MLAQTFISLRIRTPLPTPEAAEVVPMMVIAAARISWLVVVFDIQPSFSRPAAIGVTPSPSEVARPKMVPNTPIRSITCPQGP